MPFSLYGLIYEQLHLHLLYGQKEWVQNMYVIQKDLWLLNTRAVSFLSGPSDRFWLSKDQQELVEDYEDELPTGVGHVTRKQNQ